MIDLQKRVPTEEIVRQDVERTGGDFKTIYASLYQGIKSGKTRILRYNNTLLIYNITDKGVAEIHLASVDSPQEMMESFKDFYKAFQVAGFKLLHSVVEDPQIIRLVQMARIPIQAKQTPNGYEITIEVK
jgi:hypothetical protein